MAKYSKKSVIVEAFQWTGGEDQTEDPRWISDAIRNGSVRLARAGTPDVSLLITTLDGVQLVDQRDWIIRGPSGELYSCKSDTFAATYEAVDSVPLWLIACSTGCTCCSCENHYRGAYRSKEDADRRIASFLAKNSKYWPLASKYAPRGRYMVKAKEAEPISGGRFIVDDQVLLGIRFIEVAADGSVADNEVERFYL